jgi:hypothetical protein
MSSRSDPELTRKQRREQARVQRKALEEAERTRAVRRKRLTQLGGAFGVLAVIAIVAILSATGGGRSMSAASAASAGSGVSAGLRATTAPWQPEYSALETRLRALNLPTQSDSAYHIHAVLRVYVNGQQVEVPAEIGIGPEGRFLAPLHTHDTSGVIHMESSQAYPFTLAQFFAIWGVKFTNTQLGAYVADGANVLALYVNGTRVPDPVGYVMKPHDHILVAYGKPGSFPTTFAYTFAEGL